MEQERTNRNCPLWGTETCARLNMRACRGCPAEGKDPRECNDIRDDVNTLFSLLPDALTASVLQIRYLEKQPWREVCLRTHLSRTRVFARHRQALELLAAREGNSCIPGPNRGILSEADETK